MIVCPRCSKENQDHYKFCLGCGAELPRDAAQAPKSFTAPTPPAGVPAAAPPQFQAPEPAPVPAPAPAPARAAEVASAPTEEAAVPAAGGTVTCPKCSNPVPSDFKFCGTCGNPMGAAPAPAVAAAPAPAPAPAAGRTRGNLVLIRPDGSEGESMPLGDSTTLGREQGGVFANDAYLSPRHGTFVFEGDQLSVYDEDSLNGIYVRIDRDSPVELKVGDIFRIGQELLRFEPMSPPALAEGGVEPMGSPNPGYLGRLSLITGREATGNAFPIPPSGLHMGRERGDLIFPEDGYVSGLHARVHGEGGKVYLTDVGSSNGTFMRIRGKLSVRSGDLLLLGQQLFRAEY